MTNESIAAAKTVLKKPEKRELKAIDPVKVIYCGECLMPLEYCVFSERIQKCKKWLGENFPSLCENQIYPEECNVALEKKKRRKRGGRRLTCKTVEKVSLKDENMVLIRQVVIRKKKWFTKVMGLDRFEIDLKEAKKFFAKQFACGCSIQDNNERNFKSEMLVVRNGVACQLCQLLPSKWHQIKKENIKILEHEEKG